MNFESLKSFRNAAVLAAGLASNFPATAWCETTLPAISAGDVPKEKAASLNAPAVSSVPAKAVPAAEKPILAKVSGINKDQVSSVRYLGVVHDARFPNVLTLRFEAKFNVPIAYCEKNLILPASDPDAKHAVKAFPFKPHRENWKYEQQSCEVDAVVYNLRPNAKELKDFEVSIVWKHLGRGNESQTSELHFKSLPLDRQIKEVNMSRKDSK